MFSASTGAAEGARENALPYPGWLGRLTLELAQVGKRTVIARRRHEGPLLVQRAFQEPDGGCQVYLVHPPGGVVGGDRLCGDFSLGSDARALITSPAAAKLYASAGPRALLEQTCSVGAGAVLELLPQETIVYDGAQAFAQTEVTLGAGAHFFGWDITCLGRDARGFASGRFEQVWRLSRQGRLLWTERACFEGGSAVLRAAWGLAGRPVLGMFVATGATPGHVDAVRQVLPESSRDWFSASQLGEVLVCRYLGYSAEVAKQSFCAAWAVLRERVSKRNAVVPRVWAL
jgi:urease accessory protein